MAGPTNFYVIQANFAGGEISADVASRIDLDKYQMSLLQAENAMVRPYGSVQKRAGTVFCGETKYSDRKAILIHFDFTVELSYMLEIGYKYIRIWKGDTYLNIELATPFEEADLPNLRFIQSIDVMYITSGKYPVKRIMRYAEDDWRIEDMQFNPPAFGELNKDEGNYITPSGTTGTITLTATKDTFNSDMVGDWMKIEQQVTGNTVTQKTTGTSAAITIGDTWKIITHGTWTGSVTIEKSMDNGATWHQERKYTSSDDYNPTESGSVEDYCLMRLNLEITSGNCTADLSSYPYTHTGHVKITAVTNSKNATAVVQDSLGSTEKTLDWYLAAWSKANGYPIACMFFQDRLVFAGSSSNPSRIWMSKTGDYGNFGIDKEAGTVTDDSAITADLINLKAYSIKHVDAGTDLIIMTEGNEWTISGTDTVTPSSITPRNQQNYGCNDTIPIRVSNRVVYVQRRGSIIRDMGYSYDTDSYIGTDLTLLAKHLIRKHEIEYSASTQEPDSFLYFVRDDGVLICLTYVPDQRVYAWWHVITDGCFEAITSTAQTNNDVVYTIVKRTINGVTKRYIEKFAIETDSDSQQDYIMTDCTKVYNSADEPISELTGLDYLEGKEVYIMADGYLHDKKTVTNGKITLPTPANKVYVGLPYTMIIEQPNFDITTQDSGNMQGRMKFLSSCILRLQKSNGGRVGTDKDNLVSIRYDSEYMQIDDDTNILFSGDKDISLSGGFEKNGRIYIKHEEPYPFSLSAIIRSVTLGG